MDQSEVAWNAVADQLTSTLSQYDPTFQPNFVNVLVTDICQLDVSVLSSF